MDQLIVTKWKDRSLTALLSDGHCRSLTLESGDESLLGNIYIGKVKNVVKNINAAFIDLGGGKTGYFSLAENPVPLYVDELNRMYSYSGQEPDSALVKSARKLKAGDELLVQVSRDALKTKDPSVTCCLNFPGTYMVLTVGKPQIGFSAKIKDNIWKERVREALLAHKDERFGLIVRTNGAAASIDTLCAETEKLKQQMEELFARAACRTCYSLLEQGTPPYIQSLRDAKKGTLSEIITDVPEYAKKIEAWLEEEKEADKEQKENQPQADKNESINQAVPKLSLYTDENLPLMKLYRLESVLKSATDRRVWMKSGGYLVIEPTEALTVIDVNTGKYTGKKTPAETILKINLEAAHEVARQLSLRNLSGIIIVDFIDMESKEDQETLMRTLGEELSRDPVKTILVDMTRLGLVEITRKKVRRPLHEIL
ncbi:ribonuclease E/G [Clostridium sp.]